VEWLGSQVASLNVCLAHGIFKSYHGHLFCLFSTQLGRLCLLQAVLTHHPPTPLYTAPMTLQAVFKGLSKPASLTIYIYASVMIAIALLYF